ncbi:MAG: AgmX/PglI C-terminal domain-containing protein [Anaeromyxobacter sp.]|nr:AgmX/PglI C-terminal domain-containing protein [Anaeromyxobacter sp.]MBL0277796.1 AgmX/PglI C-terminal domain-containing protein [Anaeromyxobacter sp.]
MAPDARAPPVILDPALDGGEWLFQRDGQVYGPVEGRRLAELLYQGELSAVTLVSSGDGAWRPLVQVDVFLVHVRKAEAAARVEQEVTGRRVLQVRRQRTRVAGLAVGAVAVVVAAGGVAFLASRGPARRDPLLDDFGAGITIAAPARVGVARRADPAEVEVALDGPGPRAAPRPAGGGGAARDAAAARGPLAAAEAGLVESRFDEGRIQSAVAAQQRSLVPCLRAQAARSPDVEGEVPLEFTIGNEGRVVRVAVMDPRLRQGPLRDCFEQVLAGWTFDRFPGERPTVSLTFRVGP